MRPRALAIVLALAAATAADARLPAEGCIHLLREARIARMMGADAQELEILRKAEREYPAEALPVMALIERVERPGATPEERERFLKTLEERIRNVDASVPSLVIGQLVENPASSRDELVEMRAAVDARLAKAPGDAVLLEASARLAERTGDPAAALAALVRLSATAPAVDVEGWKLDLATALGRWQEAVEIARGMASRDPAAAEPRVAAGRALVELGRLEEATKEIAPLLGDAARRATAVREVVVPLAWRLWDEGKERESEDAFHAAVEADPDNRGVRFTLETLFASAEERRAARGPRPARLAGADEAWSLFNRGTERLMAGDAAAAFEQLQAAVKAAPDFEAAWFNLGVSAWKLGRWEQARRAFSEAASLKGDRAASFFYLGASLARLARCPEAVPALLRAVALDAGLRDAHGFLSECYRAMGRTTDADAEARRARASR